MSVQKKGSRAYHHGDLRAALLKAVDEIVQERGVEAISLRECARRAGVSHGAPIHHFGDLVGMLTEFSAEGFRYLDASMKAEQQAADRSATAQLRAAGMGYILFAQNRPSHFKVMFRPELRDENRPGFRETANASFNRLERCLEALEQELGDRGPKNLTLYDRALAAWSMVHGFAWLWVEGPLSVNYRQSDPQRALDVLIAGLTTQTD